jgi:hypothetical protein
MPAPVNLNMATAVRFDQMRVVNLSAATMVVAPQFAPDQRTALDHDAKAVVHSLDQRPWVTLAGWMDDVTTAVVQCRQSGLTLQIKRRANVTANLLPAALNSPSATVQYKTTAGAAKTQTFQSSIDSSQGFVKLQVPFDKTPELYDEILTAMTTPESGITATINYQHPMEVRIPAPKTTPGPIHVTTPGPIHVTTPGPIHLPPRPPVSKPGVSFRPLAFSPASEMAFTPAAAAIATQPIAASAVQPVATSVTNVAALRANVGIHELPGDIGRVWITPENPQGDRIEEHTFSGSMTMPLIKAKTDTNVFPDLPRQARNGWDQVPQSPGKIPLLFRDSGKIDTFFYIPTSFKLGFYQEADGSSTQPPMRVEVYKDADGSERIKATLVALPCIQDQERETLRTYLHDEVLQKLQPFIYLEPRSGIQADFVQDFTSGSADNSRTLPVEIQFKALDVVPSDRVKLQFDMPAEQYPIFCNMLSFGIYGRIKLSEPQFQAEVPVRLHLEDMTSNSIHVEQVSPKEGPDGKPLPGSLSITNLLSFPVQVPSLEVTLLDRGSESGMILDSERINVLPSGTQLAPQADDKSKSTFQIAPQHLVGWDTTVVEPGIVKVTAGTAQDWLDRINRDPSLQPHEFRVQLQVLASDAIRPNVQLVRVRLFKDGDTAVRSKLDIPPASAATTLHVSMTLAELMGDAGKAPAFSLEYETLAADGSLSPTQRVPVTEGVANLQLRAMVPTPKTIYTIDQDGAKQDISRADLDALISQLQTAGKHWEIFTREPAADTTTTTTTTPAPDTTKTDGGPVVSVVTDLAALKLQDGTLTRVFVVLKADQDNAPQNSFALDATNHSQFTWQSQGLKIPPFRWEITYLYANGQVKQTKGVSSDLTLILDPPPTS